MKREHVMAYQHTRNKYSRPKGRLPVPGRIGVVLLLVVLVTSIHGQAWAGETGALVRSLLIPGLGQAHQGHYGRASVYAGCAILSGFGLLLAQVHYNAAVDKYNFQRNTYAGYEDQLKNGQVINIGDINTTYADMEAAWREADGRLKWRNGFLFAFFATYTVNLVDVLISKPYKIDSDERLAIDINRDRFLVVKTIKF
jgi:hypothetical protein